MTGTARQEAGKFLKAACSRAGLSQRDLARLVGVGESEISRYARGAVTPRIELAWRMDDALDAHGELVAAWGHQDPLTIGSIADVQRQLDELRDNVTLLTEAVEGIRQQLAELQSPPR